MVEVKSREDAARLMRNAAVALSLIPLMENIDQSLDQEWNSETFAKTDEAMERFVDDLEKLGFGVVPLVTMDEALARSRASLNSFEDELGPVQ